MKINTAVTSLYNYNKSHLLYSAGDTGTAVVPERHDSVSFNGISVVGGVLAIAKVIQYGYKSLKTDLAKAEFKNEIVRRIENPNSANSASEIVDTLFALAKTIGRDEPTSMGYCLKDVNNATSLTEYRDMVLQKLFPLIPEMVEDVNHGHAAKVAMLNSMIDTGEYVYSDNFINVFSNLPPVYFAEKMAMIQKVLKDKNAISAIHKDIAWDKAAQIAEERYKYEYKSLDDTTHAYSIAPIAATIIDAIKSNRWMKRTAKQIYTENIPTIENKRATVNTAMILSMEPTKFQMLYTGYNLSIKEQAGKAFKYVARTLKHYDGKYKRVNNLYKYYSSNFKSDGSNVLSDAEQIVAKRYYMEFMDNFKQDKNKLMCEFNIGEKYYDDMYKDYMLLQNAKNKKYSSEKFDILLQARIREKMSSDDIYIRDSASALLEMLGKSEDKFIISDSQKNNSNKKGLLFFRNLLHMGNT